MPEVDKRGQFLKELKELLKKYEATLSSDDHWMGYAECGQDVRMTIEFEDYSIEDIDLGGYYDGL